ncbi:hypothetical protein [Kribbella swartbergensis]
MLEFAIFVIVMIVLSVIGKAKQQASKSGRRPNPRVQQLIERINPPPAQYQQGQLSSQWLPSYGPPPQAHRPPQHHLPTPRQDTDNRVRELMKTGNEVAAIRLLCDEQDMGILEAQQYARGLVAPADQSPTRSQARAAQPASPEPAEDETRYVGSAAFAESIFDLDREQDTWASGWVDTPEPDDRSDIDELWQTVRNPPRPGTTPPN